MLAYHMKDLGFTLRMTKLLSLIIMIYFIFNYVMCVCVLVGMCCEYATWECQKRLIALGVPPQGSWDRNLSSSLQVLYLKILSYATIITMSIFSIDCLRKEKENVCYNKLLNQGTLAILYYYYHYYYWDMVFSKL